MEFFIVLAVIAVLCLVIGVKWIYLLFAAAALLGIIIVLSELLLTFCFIRLMFTHKQTADFSRIDKSPRSTFKVAYYKIDDKEYPNIFPEEGFLRSKLYRSDKKHTVFLTRNQKCVYDKFACTTCTLGFLISIATVVAGILIMKQI
jgi:hypothetical protein